MGGGMAECFVSAMLESGGKVKETDGLHVITCWNAEEWE
jgi:hypothetical protein